MKYQSATLLLAGLATAAPVVDVNSLVQSVDKRQVSSVQPPPTTADLQRASSIISGLADGLKGSAFPGASSVSSILSGLGGGLEKGAKINTKRQPPPPPKHERPPPPTAGDMERASSILKGLSQGLSKAFPGSAGVSSILGGLSTGIQDGAKFPPSASASQPKTVSQPKTASQSAPEKAAGGAVKEKRQTSTTSHPLPTAGDMERASSILKGLSQGLSKAFPGSAGVSSILSGLSGGIKEGAKNPPAATTAAASTVKEKRQGPAVLPPPGTPEARKSAGEILEGLAKGVGSSNIPGNSGVAGILNAVGSSLEAAAALPPHPAAVAAGAAAAPKGTAPTPGRGSV